MMPVVGLSRADLSRQSTIDVTLEVIAQIINVTDHVFLSVERKKGMFSSNSGESGMRLHADHLSARNESAVCLLTLIGAACSICCVLMASDAMAACFSSSVPV